MDKIIGIGEFGIVTQPGERLITHALASCVAVTFYSRSPLVAALIHIALPEHPKSGSHPIPTESAVIFNRPGYYADSGLPLLMQQLVNRHQCDLSRMTIHLIGGADSISASDAFHIGEKNVKKIEQILKKKGVHYSNSEIGGNHSRTVIMDLMSGDIEIRYQKIVL